MNTRWADGPCSEPGCTDPAVVMVNGRKACQRHIDAVMASVLGPVGQFLRWVRDLG